MLACRVGNRLPAGLGGQWWGKPLPPLGDCPGPVGPEAQAGEQWIIQKTKTTKFPWRSLSMHPRLLHPLRSFRISSPSSPSPGRNKQSSEARHSPEGCANVKCLHCIEEQSDVANCSRHWSFDNVQLVHRLRIVATVRRPEPRRAPGRNSKPDNATKGGWDSQGPTEIVARRQPTLAATKSSSRTPGRTPCRRASIVWRHCCFEDSVKTVRSGTKLWHVCLPHHDCAHGLELLDDRIRELRNAIHEKR